MISTFPVFKGPLTLNFLASSLANIDSSTPKLYLLSHAEKEHNVLAKHELKRIKLCLSVECLAVTNPHSFGSFTKIIFSDINDRSKPGMLRVTFI